MLPTEGVRELRTAWLPNITDQGLDRLIDLLEKSSPLLIHGSFTRAVPMGCLATQAGWNHPCTRHQTHDAGINWLTHVAGLNPGTSVIVREWDRCRENSFAIRAELLTHFKEERQRRAKKSAPARDRELVPA